MPELSHDTAEDGFHEIQLSGKQLVFLFIVTTTVVVGVFLFGVLVGRGARPAPVEESPSSAIADPVAAPAPAPPPAAVTAPPVEPPPVASEGPEDLSYTALKQKGSPAPSLKTSTDAKAPRDEAKSTPAPVAAPPPPRPSVASAAKEKEPEAKPAPKPAPPAAAAKAPAPPTADVPRSAAPGVWLVQVMATREQAVATSLVKKLVSKGYPAFLVSPVAGAPQPFYKVQVGRYRDRAEADRVSQRIKKEEQFQSWILR